MGEYNAVFEIAHGVSSGFGMTDYDEISEEKMGLEADSDTGALQEAYIHADRLSKNYLADSSGYKKVTLQSLKDNSGKEIDQVEIIKKAHKLKDCPLEIVLRTLFPEGKLFIKRHWALDVLEMKPESS
jgi:hypothetical protein